MRSSAQFLDDLQPVIDRIAGGRVTKNIDVLAQLRTTYCPPECLDAVAELLAAAKDGSYYIYAVYADETEALNRLEAAIARCTGAAK